MNTSIAAPAASVRMRARAARLAFALLVPVALYAEGCCAYFATACADRSDFANNLQWSLFVFFVLPFVFRWQFALAFGTVAAGIFAACGFAERRCAARVRNRIALGLAVALPIAAAAIGAAFPTKCSFF